MSKFKKEDLIGLEKLACLKLSSDKEECFLENIQKILNYMEMLNEADTSDTPPLTHVITDMEAPLAEDVVTDKYETEDFLSNAPDKVGNFLKVPVVIEDKEEL